MAGLNRQAGYATVYNASLLLMQLFFNFITVSRPSHNYTSEWKMEMEKTLFKQGGPFSTKAGIHRGPVSRYKLFIEITKYNI